VRFLALENALIECLKLASSSNIVKSAVATESMEQLYLSILHGYPLLSVVDNLNKRKDAVRVTMLIAAHCSPSCYFFCPAHDYTDIFVQLFRSLVLVTPADGIHRINACSRVYKKAKLSFAPGNVDRVVLEKSLLHHGIDPNFIRGSNKYNQSPRYKNRVERSKSPISKQKLSSIKSKVAV